MDAKKRSENILFPDLCFKFIRFIFCPFYIFYIFRMFYMLNKNVQILRGKQTVCL